MKKLILIFIAALLLIGSVHAADNLTAQPPWCGISNLFFTDVKSDTDNFRQLNNYATGMAETDENVTISSTSGIVLIDSYYSQQGFPGSQGLLSGLRYYNLWGWVSNTGGESYFIVNVTIRHADGTSTYDYGVRTNSIEYTTPALVLTPYVNPNSFTFLPTDRLLINISAYTTSVSPKTIHFLSEGSTHYSWVQSGLFVCQNPTNPTNGNESYVYSPTNATPLGEWIVIIIAAFSLLICSFYFKLRDETGDISTERVIFSISSAVVCAFAAWLSLEVAIPSGTATIVVYQLYIVSIIMVIASIISFANFIYSIIQGETIKPHKRDYSNDERERK
jgi:hypothetical protein